jgi:valyl-tRNA synthetase
VTESHELDARYDPEGLEARIYRRWEEAGYFHADADAAGEPYTVVIPPPNVTAELHMGHGLNNTIQDVLVRWRRMQGRNALWMPGTDHAGIATQNVVERQLDEEGTDRWELGREAFEGRVWDWVEEYGATIIEQLKTIGASCDWARTRFTLDEGLSRAVREVFVRLHERGLIYRGNYIINWCPRCSTALSDEEVEHEETDGRLWWIRYPFADGEGAVEVATTRPETMLGDTAVAVHPDDERYRGLAGRTVVLPLVGRELPVVEDAFVDPEFGSGVVKVTPAHDPNDFQIGRRHDLPAPSVLAEDATVSEEAPERFRGLDRFEARERVVDELREEGLLVEVEEHRHSVGHCYRCDTVVEPRLSEQWFVEMEPLAEAALEAWEEGELRFHPEHFGREYAHWLENIRDWCISRQLWWGHRIPVWYCRDEACGETIVAREEPDACPECGGAVEQDPDVLDTWFSSWLWPFSTLGWPEETRDLDVFYPTDTLVTNADIIFFWVARMVMAGQAFLDELPFTDIVFNGTVKDHRGRRMSKSLGNGIDPMEVVDRFGADAMRWTLIRSAAPGADLQLNFEDLESTFRPGRNFANKIWNAVRFALPHLEEEDALAAPEELELELPDRWILSRFRSAVEAVDRELDRYRFDAAAEAVHGFVWGDFCDWYLELVKPRLYGDRGASSRDAAAATLAHVLHGWLRLLHPVMPFVTEELALKLPGREDRETLMLGPWPSPPPAWEDGAAERRMSEMQELVGTVRNLRSEYRVQPGQEVEIHLGSVSEALRRALEAEEEGLRALADVAAVHLDGGGDDRPGARAVLRSGTELFLPLEGVVDLGQERARLAEEIERIEGLLEGSRHKLANEDFLRKAPEEVVEREREKKASLEEQRDRLSEQRDALARSGGAG